MDWNAAKTMVPADLRNIVSRALGRDKRRRVRRYIPHGVSVEQFFTSLQEVECVVLRWFDTLPYVAPGEDIDMLVADADLPLLDTRLNNTDGSVPCDIYSVTGVPGSQYKARPYFPPKLALSSLANRELQDCLYPVPSAEDHFDGLAYHAVYQKGPASGLPTSSEITPLTLPEHDYAEVLRSLRDQLGLNVAIHMEELDQYLAGKGYRPDKADLRNLSATNPWISRRLLS